jgi:hypothetical protein
MHNLINNPLPNILKYLPTEAVFLDEKVLSSITEIIFTVTGVRTHTDKVMTILEALADAKYVEIHTVNKAVKTIKKVKDGN